MRALPNARYCHGHMAKSRLPAASPEPHRFISVRGAREHNLKNVDVDLPRDKLVVITGLSGSGKSSLAFDTIYAEGQRRYVESLSAYARQFLELMQKPDVDSIEGLSPAISIEQKTTSRNPRSTVGTVTEIYDYLRLLFARVGVPYSPATGLPIESQTVSQMVDRVMAMAEGTRLTCWRRSCAAARASTARSCRTCRSAASSGSRSTASSTRSTRRRRSTRSSSTTSRWWSTASWCSPDLGNRLADLLETALDLADGLAFAENADTGERTIFSVALRLPGLRLHHRRDRAAAVLLQQPARRLPGLRRARHEDVLRSRAGRAGRATVAAPRAPSRPGPTRRRNTTSRRWRASPGTTRSRCRRPGRTCRRRCATRSCTAPAARRSPCATTTASAQYQTTKPFEGVIPNLERRWRRPTPLGARGAGALPARGQCEACDGARLKPEALAVKIAGLNISQITDFSIGEAVNWFLALDPKLTAKQREIAARILKEINERLGFLDNVGLDYLTLARTSGTLSGGESQRIRLASQIGSGLTGVLYVLDEPSIGLHQRDNDRLLETLKRLRDLGNTVLVVEHDEEAIRTADYLVDMGPGAGVHGGKVVAEGTPDEVMQNTRQPDRPVPLRLPPDPDPEGRAASRRNTGNRWLTLKGATRQQPAERHRQHPARHLHLRHRRVGQRQVHPDHRDAVQGAGQAAEQRARASRRARQHRGHRPSRQDRRHRPVADRPHAALQPRDLHRRLHADPRLVLASCPNRPRAATSPAASRSTSRAAAARPARATASSRSRCTSCPTSTSSATSARASATTARRSRSSSAASRSPTCST